MLRYGTTRKIDSLNPFVSISTLQPFIMQYPTLTQWGPGREIVGDWAKDWETSSDGLTWTYHLREGTWSDGEPLTSDDAVFTGETILRYQDGPTGGVAAFLDGIAGFEAPDPLTLVIHYEKPVGIALPNLTEFFVLPQHVWESHIGDDGKGLKSYMPEEELPVVAGGPFMITEYEPRGATIFETNPGYYGDAPSVDGVGYVRFENDESMLQAFDSGELDWVTLPPKVVTRFESDERFVIDASSGMEPTAIVFNSNPKKPDDPELQDLVLREAFSYAIDRQEILDVVYGGQGVSIGSFLPPGHADWVNPQIEPTPYDPGHANELLDAAGYELGPDGVRIDQDGEPMSYEVLVPTDWFELREFEIVEKNLADVGIELTPVEADGATWFELNTAPDGEYLEFDITMESWNLEFDPNFMLDVFTCRQWFNWNDSGYCDKGYDALFREQVAAVDQEKRREIVWEMQDQIVNQHRVYVPLVAHDEVSAHSVEWTGFHPELATWSKFEWTEVQRSSTA